MKISEGGGRGGEGRQGGARGGGAIKKDAEIQKRSCNSRKDPESRQLFYHYHGVPIK